MRGMSNQSYLNVWCKDFPEEKILERLGAFLGTVPLSAAAPGFTYLTIRAIDGAEPPLVEHDLRAAPMDSAGIVELAREQMRADCACEVRCEWDLWVFDPETAKSKNGPQPLSIYCYGEAYDDGIWRENGHFEAELGFEHLFTGHAGLLGFGNRPVRAAENSQEAHFLEAMAWPENLKAYQEKTQSNIRKLLEWARGIEGAVPVERLRMWSEGEENFEARVEEILAAR